MIHERLSPNHDDRRGQAISLLILHYTGMVSAQAALDRLCDPAAKVSAHYLIDEDGALFALVPETRRAWHAGVAAWRDIHDVNAASIGIELVNPGHEFGYRPFPSAQMTTLTTLAQAIVARHSILARHVLGHSDVAPLRKQDPGELFDWGQLATAGVGLMPPVVAVEPGGLWPLGMTGAVVSHYQAQLADFGYSITQSGVVDDETVAVTMAFQRHFRPDRVDGRVDAHTRSILTILLQQLEKSENRA